MLTIAMCKAACGDCGREFAYPTLGDFAYGEFILHGEDGRTFRYLHGMDNEVWNFVAAHIQPMKNNPAGETGAILQEVVARLADPVDGHSFTMRMVCPHCRSHHFREWGGERISYAEVPDATFQSFTSLDERGRENLLGKFEREIRGERDAAANARPRRR